MKPANFLTLHTNEYLTVRHSQYLLLTGMEVKNPKQDQGT